MEYIFVYGTLRKGNADALHELLNSQCEYYCAGYMTGKLYEVNGYPGAIESGNPADKVIGELYSIRTNQDLFIRLDEYEECSPRFQEPHEYIRKKIVVALFGGGYVEAWAYIYNHDVVNLSQIESGDYLTYSELISKRA